MILEKKGHIEIEAIDVNNGVYSFRVHFINSPKEIAKAEFSIDTVATEDEMPIIYDGKLKLYEKAKRVFYKDMEITNGELDPEYFDTMVYLMKRKKPTVDILTVCTFLKIKEKPRPRKKKEKKNETEVKKEKK